MMQVNQAMTTKVVSIGMDDSLKTVKELFDNTGFHHFPVIEDGHLMGLISEHDLLTAISPNIGLPSETPRDLATLNKRAHQIMTRALITARSDADIYEAVNILVYHDVSIIPVVDNGQLVGIISWRDLLRALIKDLDIKTAEAGAGESS
jgi:acetoin utilization protein AcuB